MTPPIVLLGLPYDGSSSFKRGAAKAPGVIRKALTSPATNSWSEALVDVVRGERIGNAGDINLDKADDVRATIEARIGEIVAAGQRPISLGGDHSVTYPIVRGFASQGKFTLLQIDAHGDLYDEFQGDRYSHACPFTRIMEEGLVQRLVQIGVRTMNEEQRQNADRFGVETIDMRAWSAGARPAIAGPIYVSIDMDAFDPAFAPGVSHREPGGLTTREVISLLQGLEGSVIGADIVEFNPSEDPAGLTAPLCAKLVKELAARMLGS